MMKYRPRFCAPWLTSDRSRASAACWTTRTAMGSTASTDSALMGVVQSVRSNPAQRSDGRPVRCDTPIVSGPPPLDNPYRDSAEPGFNPAYRGTPPWDISRPQAEFVRLEESGEIRGSVLDVGCGTGEHVLYLARRGHEAWGIDSAPLAIEKAREIGAARHSSNVRRRRCLRVARFAANV